MDILFFPKSEVPVKVCDYLYGAESAFVQNTDQANADRFIFEMYAFRHNIQITAFVNPWNSPAGDMDVTERTGRVTYDLYLPTDRWSIGGIIDIIPDYTATTWTSQGASVFVNAVEGVSKPSRFPNHGQELFDISDGLYGWDYINGVPGENKGRELFNLLEFLENYFFVNLKKGISSFAYRNGQTGGSLMLMKYFLGGRNSELLETNLSENGQTDYGNNEGIYLGFPEQDTSRSKRINQPSTTRYKDMYEALGMGSEAQVRAYFTDQLELSISNGGFFNDFIHHHQWTGSNIPKLNSFFQMVNDTISDSFVWRTSYGEAIQYLFFREMVGRVSAFESNGVVKIVADKTDKFKEISTSGISERTLYNLLKVPISIEVDLSGTTLSGKNITSNIGSIRSLGLNKYVVQIPFNNEFEGFISIELSETTESNYLDFSLPVITSSVISDNTLIVQTDKPTRAMLMKGEEGTQEYLYTLHGRSNELSIKHEFDISGFETYDFKAGVITKEGQSTLN